MSVISDLNDIKPRISLKGNSMFVSPKHDTWLAITKNEKIVSSANNIIDLVRNLEINNINKDGIILTYNNKNNAVCLW